MKIYSLKREQFIDKPAEQVFEFFNRPENLSRITPPWLGFKIMTPPPLVMKEGALVDYSIRLLIFRIHWRTIISLYDPPHRFVDEQLKGPYSFWHHTHTFAPKEGGTLIIDEVRYVLPLGFIGRIINWLFIRWQLKKIFDYRAEIIENFFQA